MNYPLFDRDDIGLFCVYDGFSGPEAAEKLKAIFPEVCISFFLLFFYKKFNWDYIKEYSFDNK